MLNYQRVEHDKLLLDVCIWADTVIYYNNIENTTEYVHTKSIKMI